MDKKFLEQWLREAYVMEKSAIEILEKQAKTHGEFPECQAKILEHLDQTYGQVQQLDECLERLGVEPSALDAMDMFPGNLSALNNAPAEDHVIKDLIADASFEYMEVAIYRCLIAAAEECDEPEIKEVCEQILQQEEAAAAWLKENIAVITQEFMNSHAAHVR